MLVREKSRQKGEPLKVTQRSSAINFSCLAMILRGRNDGLDACDAVNLCDGFGIEAAGNGI